DLFSCLCRSSHQNDPGHASICPQHRRNQRSFAVANRSHSRRSDLLPRFHVIQCTLCISGKILRLRRRKVSIRFADSALVVSHHRDSFSRQIISQHQKRPVACHILVPVLRTGTRNQQCSRERSRPLRNRQSSSQRHCSTFIGEADFFFFIGKRLHGILRPPQLQNFIRPFKLQRDRIVVLRPLSCYRVVRRVQRSFINSRDHRNLKVHGAVLFADFGHRQIGRSLIQTVQSSAQFLGLVVRNM